MSIARAKRWRIQCPVQVASQDFFDETKTMDVSLRGLSIATTRSIPRGTQLYVRLLLPDRKSSVDYEICTVRWARDGRIGVEAYQMTPEEEQRLRKHIPSLTGIPERTGEYPTVGPPADEPINRIRSTVGMFWQAIVKSLIALNAQSQPSGSSLQKHENAR
jgi:hypothetical protein